MVVPTQGWMKCPRGELARLSTRLRTRRVVKTVLTVAAVLMGTIVTAAAVQVTASFSSDWFSLGGHGGQCGQGGCGLTPVPAPVDGCGATPPSQPTPSKSIE